jgi:hypothetical protein
MADLTTDEYSYKLSNDGSAAIFASWESKDENMQAEISAHGKPIGPSDYKTLSRVTIRCRGLGVATTAAVGVSVDGGATYQAATGPSSIPTTGGEVNYDIWITGTKFRVKIENRQPSEPFPAVEEILLHYRTRGEK